MNIPPVAPEQLIAVTLQAQEWNWLLDVIVNASAPYRVTAPLIGKITQQTMAAAVSLQPQVPHLHAIPRDETA